MPRVDLLQLRRGTAAEWVTANPVLALGEPGLETDTQRVKYGDAVSAWNVLEYAEADSSAIEAELDALTVTVAGKADEDHSHIISNVAGLQAALDAKLALAGGTLTGGLTLAGAPTEGLHAATKTYVDGIASGGLPHVLGDVYYASDHGIVPASADNSAALQTLIDTIAALERNATILFEEEGPYIFAGALQDTARTNCVIRFPEVDINSKQYTIRLKGGAGSPSFSPSAFETVPLSAGTKLKCTTNTGSGTRPAFIGGMGPVGGNANETSYMVPSFEDVTFLMPRNPVLSCINLNNYTNTSFIGMCAVIAGATQSVFDAQEPTTSTSFGVIHPQPGSGVVQLVEGSLNILGFYNGMLVGENAFIKILGIFSCKNGIVYQGAFGTSRISRFQVGWCPTAISIQGGHVLIIDEMTTERWLFGGWYHFVRDIDDGSNVAAGEIRWETNAAAYGRLPGTFTVNGAANIYLREFGISPAASTPRPKFGSAEVGAVNDTTVAVTFSQPVKAATYTAGVTITVNGTPATISSATRQAGKDVVYYVLQTGVTNGQNVAFSYEAADGFISNEAGTHLADVASEPVINSVGGSSVVVYDAFFDTDGTIIPLHTMTIGSGWTKIEGGSNETEIVNNKAQSLNSLSQAYVYVTESGVSDSRIEATFSFSGGSDYCELFFRLTDLNNHWTATVQGTGANNMQLAKVVAGVYTAVNTVTVPVTVATPYLYVVTLAGNNISFSFDGGTPIATIDPFNVSATKCGFKFFGGGGDTLDNFTVTS